MEHNYNVIYDYLTNDNTKIKKIEFLNSISFLNNHNYNMNDLKFLINKYIDKTTFYYRIEKDSKLYHDLIRKIMFNNNEEQIINEFAKNKYSVLFTNRIITQEDYKYFKGAFLEYIENCIRNKLDRFKHFEDFVDYHYEKNEIKENNKLLSKILILRDCTYPVEYLQILNKKNINYTLESFLLITKESIIKDENSSIFKHDNTFFIIEEIMDNLMFFEVNKLALTKCLKHHGFSIFSLLLLINCIKKYKLTVTNYKTIFDLLEEYNKKFVYNNNHDKYLSQYFEYCIDKKYIKEDINILNYCAKHNVKKLFNRLIDLYKIKPDENTLNEILDNIKSNDCDNLNKLIDMKFIINKEQIIKILRKGKLNNKLKEVLIKNNYIELNDEIFENYIKYENYIFKDYRKSKDKIKISKDMLQSNNYFYEMNTLLDFNLDKTIDYFDIIHKNNYELNYDLFINFLIDKCKIQKKQINHILEFSRQKYKKNDEKENSYKDNIDKYIDSSKLQIDKYCLDMCMKAGNYEAGIYLIEKYKLKPDNTTLLFVKDTTNRIQFSKLYF